MPAPFRWLATFAALVLAALSLAQPDPVSWSARLEPPRPAAGSEAVLVVEAVILPTWHLYSLTEIVDGPQPTVIQVVEGPLETAGEATQAKPESKMDPNFEKVVEMYSGTAWFRLPVRVAADAVPTSEATVSIRYMACDDNSCLPPKTVQLKVQLDGSASGGAVVAPPSEPGEAASDPPAAVGNAARIQSAKGQGLLAFLWLSIGFGFLSLLTPCVFPMIPITVSFFAKRREQDGAGSALGQALAYCGGIILTFTGLGLVVATLFKAAGVQALATNPWLNLVLGALFVALALNLFGVFEIRMPMGLANRVSPQGKGRYVAPLFMALTFTLTSFTCTMPLVGTLLVGASQGDYFYAIIGMLAFSTAFASPFFLLALFPGALAKLPRSGAWMVTVKAFMGFLEIAAAVKFLSNADLVWQLHFITRPVFLALWAAIMSIAGLYMMGWLRIPTVDDGKPGVIRRGFGLASLALSAWFFHAINGAPIGELDAFLPPDDYGAKVVSAESGRWIPSLDEALAKAKETGKPVFIDFTGVTCTNCRAMEKNIFPKSEVEERFQKYVLAKLYTDRDTAADRANQQIQQRLTGSVTLPIYVALSPDGKPIAVFEGSTRDPAAFAEFLDEGLGR